jgi:hypothetical protein
MARRTQSSVIMPQGQKGGLESAMPVIGGLASMYFGGDYGTGSAVGTGVTDVFKGGSAKGGGTVSAGQVNTGNQGASVTGGLQSGGMGLMQSMTPSGGQETGKTPAQGPTSSNMESNLGYMQGDMREGPSMAGAMDRRYESYSQDPQGDIAKGRAALDSDTSLPEEEKKKLKDVLDKAAYQSQRPAGSTAPNSAYIQNRRY